MKRIYTISLLIFFCYFGGFSQNVSNVRFEQKGNDVIIRYDLDKKALIHLSVCTGGSNWNWFREINHGLSGDFGKVRSRGSKKIVWKPLTTTFGDISSDQVAFRVTAKPIPKKQPPRLFRNLDAHFFDMLGVGYEHNEYGDYFIITLFRYHNRFLNVGTIDFGANGTEGYDDYDMFFNWFDAGLGIPLITGRNASWVLKTSVNWSYKTFYSAHYEGENINVSSFDFRVDLLIGGMAPFLKFFVRMNTDKYISFGATFNYVGLLEWY